MNNQDFTIIDDPLQIYHSMIKDIKRAKISICIEMFQFDDDSIGGLFKDAIKSAITRGVRVKFLADRWGSHLNAKSFSDMKSKKFEFRFFKDLVYLPGHIYQNHCRDHKKVFIIDDKITYVGSANISSECVGWRELVIRFTDKELIVKLRKAFFDSWKHYSYFLFNKSLAKNLHSSNYTILRDVPSRMIQNTRNAYVELINSSSHNIRIVTPYFLPDSKVRKALKKALSRGVNIKIIVPEFSDSRLADIAKYSYFMELNDANVFKKSLHKKIFNNKSMYDAAPEIIKKYFSLSRKKIKIFSSKRMVHSKLLIADDTILVGSSNLDYRSFVHQYELNVVLKNIELVKQLNEYFDKLKKDCNLFNRKKYNARSFSRRFAERLVRVIEELL